MFQKLAGVLFFVLSVVGSTAAAGDKKWDHASVKYGVNAWAKNFPACNGTSQSPIDIKNPTYSNLGNISFTNYDAVPSNVVVTAKNNGHSYSVSFTGFTDVSSPKISSGGLPGDFKLIGFHFHWGADHSLGSEHHVNGMDYPAELHLVHLNMKYPNVSVGVNNADGLAVLGVLLQQGQYNDKYDFLYLTEQNVTYPDMASNFNLSTLMGLLPSDKSFYRYNGSLTTPGCQQAVTWTVFANTVEISETQLKALRDMKYVNRMNETQPLVNNHRPIQALNGRMVLANFHAPSHPGSTPSPTPSSTPSPTPSSTPGPTTTTATRTTTDGASGISENHFMLLASLCLVLLSFLET